MKMCNTLVTGLFIACYLMFLFTYMMQSANILDECNSVVCCSIWINSVHNAGMKSVIVLGCASHYYNFLTCITDTIN